MMGMKTIQGICRMSKLRLLLLAVVLLLSWGLPAYTFAAGGDYVWAPYNVAVVGNQEAKASVADSQGNLILVGSTDTNGTDIHIVKVKADGSGILWSVSKDATGGVDVATAVVGFLAVLHDFVMGIRVSEELEYEGMDLAECGCRVG